MTELEQILPADQSDSNHQSDNDSRPETPNLSGVNHQFGAYHLLDDGPPPKTDFLPSANQQLDENHVPRADHLSDEDADHISNPDQIIESDHMSLEDQSSDAGHLSDSDLQVHSDQVSRSDDLSDNNHFSDSNVRSDADSKSEIKSFSEGIPSPAPSMLINFARNYFSLN